MNRRQFLKAVFCAAPASAAAGAMGVAAGGHVIGNKSALLMRWIEYERECGDYWRRQYRIVISQQRRSMHWRSIGIARDWSKLTAGI